MPDDSSTPDQTFVRFDDHDFKQIQTIKHKHGVSWREMLIAGAIRLTRTAPLSDPPDLPPEVPLQSRDCDETNHLSCDDPDDEQGGAS